MDPQVIFVPSTYFAALGREEFHSFALRPDKLAFDLLKMAPLVALTAVETTNLQMHERRPRGHFDMI